MLRNHKVGYSIAFEVFLALCLTINVKVMKLNYQEVYYLQ